MKKLSLLLLPLLFANSVSSLKAEDLSFKKQNEVSLRLGYLFFEGNKNLKDNDILGLQYGRYLTEEWQAEISIESGHTTRGNSPERVDILLPSLSALYHFGNKPLRPFITAGLGLLKLQPVSSAASTHVVPKIGAGVKWHFHPSFFTRADANYIYDPNTSQGQNNLLMGVNIGWMFLNPFECPPGQVVAMAETIPTATPTKEDADADTVPNVKDNCPDTPIGIPVDKTGCGDQQFPTEHQWVIYDVNFAFDSAHLTKHAAMHIDEVVTELNSKPTMTLEVQGHTDNRGPASYNQQLSEERAASVKTYLVSKGIASERIQIRGFGDTLPLADNSTMDGRLSNRRIEFKILSR
jgi:OmpA-OmpF porin, OOP family